MLSSAAIQIIAIASMTIDHVGLYLLGGFIPFRIIGRLAFPLFALMLVEGFKHTHSRKKYFFRIIAAAIIAEIPVFLLSIVAHAEYSHNVLFTLAFSFLALMIAEHRNFGLIFLPIIALIPSALNCDYGAYGALLILGFYFADYFFSKQRFLLIAAQATILVAMMLSLAQYNGWDVLAYGSLAIIPIALYSGKKGHRLPRWFAYIYYPAHLFAILFIRLAFY